MDTTYSRAVALAVPVFLSLIALEILADRIRGTKFYHLADAVNSLSCGVVSTGMRVFIGFIGIFTYEWVLTHAAPVRLSSEHWATWVFAFVFYDFCYYWNHRLGHRVGLLWASHVVHHQSEEFNLTTALRQPATGGFTAWIFYLPMAVSGIPLSVFLLVGVAQLFYQFWPHTRVIGRLGILDRWIQTPSNHRVHHAQNDVYLDKNYVGVFLIWDRTFGTFEEEHESEPCIYGIRGQLKSWNPVWANLHYYASMFRDSVHARSWADKVRIWFAPPGWRPADVAARFPKPDYDPKRDFERFDPPRNTSLSLYALAQFLVLAGANSHFLSVLQRNSLGEKLAYFGFILCSLVLLGGVLENRRRWIRAEAARVALCGVAGFAMASGLGVAIAGSAAVSLVWLWLATRTRAEAAASASA